MSSLNDLKRSVLQRHTDLSLSIQDMERHWLKVATDNHPDEKLDDLWLARMQQLGYGNHQLNDAWFESLGDQGHTGALQDRWYSYWQSGEMAPLGPNLFHVHNSGGTEFAVWSYVYNSAGTKFLCYGKVKNAAGSEFVIN